MSRDEAGRIAEESLQEFIKSMALADNPGSGRHEIGIHHVRGWILDYDPTVGGAEIQTVIGLDGDIHARQDPRSLHTHKWSASQWVLRDADDTDPVGRASAFADHLSRILAFDHVGETASGDEAMPWGQPLADEGDRPNPDNDAQP